jgi:hypothetical protein
MREIAVLFLVKREMRCSPRQLLCSSRLGRSQESSSQSVGENLWWLTSGIHHVHIRMLGRLHRRQSAYTYVAFVGVDLNMVGG